MLGPLNGSKINRMIMIMIYQRDEIKSDKLCGIACVIFITAEIKQDPAEPCIFHLGSNAMAG